MELDAGLRDRRGARARRRGRCVRQQRLRALDELPRGARVGTSSLRRQAQLRALRPGPRAARPARQRQHAPGQARRRRLRRDHARLRRPRPARLRRAHPRAAGAAGLAAGGGAGRDRGRMPRRRRRARCAASRALDDARHAALRRRRARDEPAPARQLQRADRRVTAWKPNAACALWGLVGDADERPPGARRGARSRLDDPQALGQHVAALLLESRRGRDAGEIRRKATPCRNKATSEPRITRRTRSKSHHFTCFSSCCSVFQAGSGLFAVSFPRAGNPYCPKL